MTHHFGKILSGCLIVALLSGCDLGSDAATKADKLAPPKKAMAKKPSPAASNLPGGDASSTSQPDYPKASNPSKKNAPTEYPVNCFHFRGNDWRATSDNRKIATKWSPDRGVIWKTRLPGPGASTPIIAGKKVFLTSYTGYGTSDEDRGEADQLVHHVMCFDRRHGKYLWTREIQGTKATQKLNVNLLRHGFASSTPATDGQRLFCFFGISGVHAFDMEGGHLWQTDVGTSQENFGSSASLLVYRNLLVVNASIEDKKVFALDKKTGKAVWKIDGVHRTWTTPTIGYTEDGQPELIINQTNFVRGFDPLTGEELWRCKAIEDYIVSVPVCVNGICYLNGGKQKRALAIKLGGRGDVTETHKLWQVPLGANVSSPVYHKGRIFVVNDGGVLQCIDAETGGLIKKQRVKTKGHVFSSPTIVGQHLLIPTMDHGVYVFEADDKMKKVCINNVSEDIITPFQSSLAISANRMYLRDDKFLYCLGRTPRSNTTVMNDYERGDQKLVIPPGKLEFDPATGRRRQYLDYFISDPDDLVKFILIPYRSVMTEEQVTGADRIIKEHFQTFVDRNKQFEDLKWKYMQEKHLSFGEYRKELEKIDEVTMKHAHYVRKLVKDQFSKEQMEQHMKDVRERRKKREMTN